MAPLIDLVGGEVLVLEDYNFIIFIHTQQLCIKPCAVEDVIFWVEWTHSVNFSLFVQGLSWIKKTSLVSEL